MENQVLQNQVSERSPEDAGLFELGAVLGQVHAFAVVAGRCSAAQARFLKDLRDSRQYKIRCAEWKEFCPGYLNMSRAQADRIIALYEKYGPPFFELSQLTRISPETYEAVEPLLHEGALHFDGEAIELDPENAQKVAAVVARLRRQAPPQTAESPDVDRRLARIEKRFFDLVTQIAKLMRADGEHAGQCGEALARMSDTLARLLPGHLG